MRHNVGRTDAWIRGAMAVVFLVIAGVFYEQTVLSLVAILLAILFGGTALTRTCPLYTVLGMDTHTHHPA